MHEFGHFIVAKKCGIMVREFSIGMGPKLFYYRRNHTTYTIRILPLGGYVRLAGSVDDEADEIQPGTPVKLQINDNDLVTKIDLSNKNQMLKGIPFQVSDADLVNGLWIEGFENGNENEKKRFSVDHDALIIKKDGIGVQIAPADVQFQNAPVYKQIMVNAAGIINNVILAIVAFTILAFMQGGVSNNSNQIDIPNNQPSVAKDAGIKSGDRIIAIDGHKTNTFQDIGKQIEKKPDQKIKIKVLHDKKDKNVTLKTASQQVQKKKVGIIGIKATTNDSFGAKITSGFTKTWSTTVQLAGALWSMVSGHFSLNNLGGPVAIYASTSQATSYGITGVVALLAWLSINLAVVNLIPIPALDGGKIFLNVIQAIRGKPISEKTETVITLIGFGFLVILMILVTWNDIMRYFVH
ncbi:protease eep [Fructilactobacillus lindneri DSM 20690 = JCM 11027]|uniref:Zinc metalloprotease n=1 Tax=Fructilactobacillus lindneri DSM 20690 = JCM 11027 TaxID=1122148 RepID=A0A0R2JSU4_9LACO|nr:protease eep [Fructilactobacillus lindneri DSM 20690 = JCM 11027]